MRRSTAGGWSSTRPWSRNSRTAACRARCADRDVGTVLLYLGKDPNSQSPEDLQAAEKVLMAIRPYIRYVHSSRYIDDLANGEICLALGWSRRHQAGARPRAGSRQGYRDRRTRIPKEGTIMNFDMLAIPADAPHPKNAHVFINYLLRPEVAAQNTNFVKYANGNAAVDPLLNKAVLERSGHLSAAGRAGEAGAGARRDAGVHALLTRTWTRFKTGK